MKNKTTVSLSLILATLGIAWNTSAAVTVTGLWPTAPLGGYWSVAYGGSNGDSSAVGDAETSTGYSHASFSNGSTTIDLGTLPGGYYSRVYDMAWNSTYDGGKWVGYSQIADGNYHAMAVPFFGGAKVDLGTLGGYNSYAYSVNSSGQIVGESEVSPGSLSHAFLYSGGRMIDLGTLGGAASYALAISDSGKVVGSADTGSAYHAFLYSGGTMANLGTLGGINSRAFAINDTAGIVGSSDIGGYVERAFLYKNGAMSSLGTLTGSGISCARGIDSAAEIVGYSTYSTSSNATHPFLYKNGVMYDLHKLAASAGLLSNGSTVGFVSLDTAFAVNDWGSIVGNGMYYDGTGTTNRGFVLQYTTN
jgi:probable HAF family extracellular repeat protein